MMGISLLMCHVDLSWIVSSASSGFLWFAYEWVAHLVVEVQQSLSRKMCHKVAVQIIKIICV